MGTNTCNFIQYISRWACAVKAKNWGPLMCTHYCAPNELEKFSQLNYRSAVRYSVLSGGSRGLCAPIVCAADRAEAVLTKFGNALRGLTTGHSADV